MGGGRGQGEPQRRQPHARCGAQLGAPRVAEPAAAGGRGTDADRDRDEGKPGHDRGGAMRLLEPVGQQREARHQRPGAEQRGRGRCGEARVAQQPPVDDGPACDQLGGHEQEQAEPRNREPDLRTEVTDDGSGDRGDAGADAEQQGGGEDGPGDIELDGAPLVRDRHKADRQPGADGRHRHPGPEDRLPAAERHQQPPERRTGQAGQGLGDHQHRHRPAGAPSRGVLCDQRQAAGGQHAATDRLHRARDQQGAERWRQGGHDRAGPEHREAEQVDASPAEAIAEPPQRRQRRGDRHQVDAEHPLAGAERHREVTHQGVESHRHDGGVGHADERPDSQRDQQPAAARRRVDPSCRDCVDRRGRRGNGRDGMLCRSRRRHRR